MLTYLAKLVPVYFSEHNISGSWFASWSLSYGIGALLTGLLVTRLLARISHEKAMMYSVISMGSLLIVMAVWLTPVVLVSLTMATSLKRTPGKSFHFFPSSPSETAQKREPVWAEISCRDTQAVKRPIRYH